MGPKSTAGKSSKAKADDVKSTKSKVSQKRRPPSVAKSQISKAEVVPQDDQAEKVKSQTSQRYEEVKDEQEVELAQSEQAIVQEEAPTDVNADENIEEDDGGVSLFDLKENTTKGLHLESELGQLKSMTGTMRNQQLDDEDALILEQGVNDNATDYKAKQDDKSEVNDDQGILGDRHEEIQPVIKNDGISDEHIQIASEAWTELLKKGELNIGRVLFKNIFQIQPILMNSFNPEGKDQKELFQDPQFQQVCTSTIQAIGMSVSSIQNINDMVPSLIDLGESYYQKGISIEDYPVVLQAMQLTLKAGLRQNYSNEIRQAVNVICTSIFKHMQYEWYTNPALQGNELTQERIEMVQSSWANAKDLGYEAVGDLLFQNIFEAAPSTLQMFSFGAHNDYRATESYKNHTEKVASTLSTAIENLQNLEELAPILKNLGADHVPRGILKEHYPVVMGAVVKTLKDNLGTIFTPAVQKAWKVTLNIVQDTMISDNYDQDLKGDELTQKRIEMVKSSWESAKGLGFEAVGDILFQNIFAAAPSTLQMFSFGAHHNYRSTQQYKNHTVKVASTLSTAVDNLQDLDVLAPILKKLGADHVPRGILKEHYPVVMNAVMKTLKDNLGEIFTPSVEKAWQVTLNIVQDTMISDNYELPEDVAEKFLSPDPNLEKGSTYRNMESMAITVQNTEREIQMYGGVDKNSQSMRSDRNEDTMRPLGEEPQRGDGLGLEQFGKQKTQHQNEEVFDNYMTLFRKEVDFHHKVAYRFEKAYRLGKKVSDRKQSLNLEIIDCISEHSGYIEQDPMALFYCLFFCIYFKNEDLVEFLRNLIHKIHTNEKIDRLLEYIDQDGIDKIRTVGEQINQVVYHMVFYQAIDDNLRIVYSQILRQLRLLQMRDKDALHLLNTRDYEMIRLTFEKHTTKIDMKMFYKQQFSIKASTYRKYSPAYYEEIVITDGTVEPRVSQNYREKFLITADDIYIVFEMYCKEDYDTEFISTQKDEITHQQFIDLFIICMKNDSFKIGILIYSLYLNLQTDIDNKMMDILMGTIKDSVQYHEMKLFLIHEHFDTLSIEQMNYLVDVYQDILHSKEPKGNPIISQYNAIKVALLIYRICWKIEKKQIYSLITKCQLLQNYLVYGLQLFFEKQNNILVLYKFMAEPILHMTERKDSLDIMYEMNMQKLLQHPVVVEVLNLVYEGKYSVSSSSLSMSQTFQCTLEMETMSLKSINDRLLQNVINFGDTGSQKQTSLQYNIWKQSIQQRQQDEMLFTSIISFVIIYFGIQINLNLNQTFKEAKLVFGTDISRNTAIFLNADSIMQKRYCDANIPLYIELHKSISMFYLLIILLTIGMFTSTCQKFLVYRTKDNVTLPVGLIALEISIFAAGILYIFSYTSNINNNLLSDVCGQHMKISGEDKNSVDKTFSLLNAKDGEMDFKLVISTLIVQMVFISIIMLQRTQTLGELIMMLDQMKNELSRFFLTFGLVILVFLLLGRMLSTEFKYSPASFFEAFLDLFNAFNGNIDFTLWTTPIGQIYIVIFMYMFKILLMSLLAAMFINRYKTVWVNLDAYRRFTIIKLKNSISYDKFIGGVTLTFFPINIIMLPFSLILTALRTKRGSDIMLKIQYSIMMIIYCIISAFMFIPTAPILIFKVYTNSIFIFLTNKRETYMGENFVQLLMAIVLGPILMVLSIVIDLLSLPNVLLKDGKNFEHKYQLSEDRLTDAQIKVVMETFVKIFYKQAWNDTYKNTYKTLIELMIMHRGIFSLIDNIHYLVCRGNKDYQQALSNVQDYNMTKILTRQCSIPDINGDYKEARCDLNTIYAIQFDIELYNYVDATLRKLRMGILRDEITQKERGIAEIIEQKGPGQEEEGEDDDDELKKVEGVNPILIGPDGAPMKRNNSDVMNNFFINSTVRCFTDIDKQVKNQNTQDSRSLAKFNMQVEQKKKVWEETYVGQFEKEGALYENYINNSLGLASKEYDIKSFNKKTESTHSSKDRVEKANTIA